MGALPKALVNMDFIFLFSGKWVLKEVAIIAHFHSQAIAGLGGRRQLERDALPTVREQRMCLQ